MNRFIIIVCILMLIGCKLTKEAKPEINLKDLSTAASLIDEAIKLERTISKQ